MKDHESLIFPVSGSGKSLKRQAFEYATGGYSLEDNKKSKRTILVVGCGVNPSIIEKATKLAVEYEGATFSLGLEPSIDKLRAFTSRVYLDKVDDLCKPISLKGRYGKGDPNGLRDRFNLNGGKF